MAISSMYPAMPGSPKTEISVAIGANATSITVADGSCLPDAPNLAVLGSDDSAEVVLYRTKSGNTISNITRGMGNTTAKPWAVGTEVARNYTSFDHDRFIENINELESSKLSSVSWGAIGGRIADQSDLVTTLSEKADLDSPSLTGTPTAPTASNSTNSTQIATTAWVQNFLKSRYYKSYTLRGVGIGISQSGSTVISVIFTIFNPMAATPTVTLSSVAVSGVGTVSGSSVDTTRTNVNQVAFLIPYSAATVRETYNCEVTFALSE